MLSQLFNLSSNPILLFNGDMIIERSNPAIELLLGCSKDDLIGRKLSGIFFDNGDVFDENKIIENDPEFWGQKDFLLPKKLYLRKSNGNSIHVEGYAGVCELEGKVYSAILLKLVTAFGTGMTENELFSGIIGMIGNLLIVSNSQGKIVYVSPSIKNLLGYEQSELLGDGWWGLERFSEGNIEEEKNYVRQAAGGKVRVDTNPYEHKIRHKNGSWHTFLISDAKGPKDFLIGIGTDITTLKKTEDALRNSELSIRSLYDIASSHDLFETKISSLLKMGKNRFGLDFAVFSMMENGKLVVLACDTPDGSIKTGDKISPGHRYSDEEMEKGLIISFSNNFAARNDSYSYFHENGIQAFLGSPIRISGNKEGILSYFSKHSLENPFSESEKDFLSLMSQWIKTELERLEASRRLQEYADEIEVKNKDLSRARDRALEASNLKSVFLAMMSHEIRTPMNAIIGMNEILMETNLDSEQREFATIVSDSAASLMRILNDILDFSKIEAGKLVIKTESMSVEKLVKDAIDLYKEKINRKEIRVNVVIDPIVPASLIGDPVRIGQILINLISNAVKFTDKGEINIRINGTSIKKNFLLITFSIEDSGIGIPEEKRNHLFDPFTQADESVTRKYGGTGLGLAISRRLVELMHGELGFISNEKSGSTFWFSLPFMLQKPGQGKSSDTAEDSRLLEQKKYFIRFDSTLPVLIVDNDPGSRNLFEQQLSIFGLKSLKISTGREAIELIRNNPGGFSLILMDINMPDLDGLTATRQIRIHEENAGRHMPIVAVTANAMLGDKETCISAGMDDYLSKPIRMNDMSRMLEKWIRLDD